ncbi:MAG TPA: DUF4157 domain-containing protein, partial [Allosphingosinicella sp.]|nr:DUF4157 domain-containing protein [Allosphingosinicella sp.]
MNAGLLSQSPAQTANPVPAPKVLQRACACGGSAGASGKCSGCDTQEKLGLPLLQPKLEISAPDDPYEQEADAVAERVMRMPGPAAAPVPVSPVIQREAAAPDEDDMVGTPVARMVQRDPMGPEQEDELVAQRKATAGAGPAPPSGLAAALGSQPGGAALPAAARAFFEPRFQRDLSHVRVHDGASAAAMASGINARAFTTGRDIYFGAGQYDPASSAGRRLLAHELTHVFQQGAEPKLRRKALDSAPAAEPTVRLPMDSPDNPNETAAETVAADSGSGGAGDAPPPGGAAPSDGAAELPASLASGILRPSGGTPLPANLRAPHERRLGSALHHVRIHQGPAAARLADALDARAFTFGADVWLGEGESLADSHLIAHELTHVVQQSPRAREAGKSAEEPRLQASRHFYYALPPIPTEPDPGTRSHNYLLPRLGKAKGNDGLYTEAPVTEGAMSGGTGRADLMLTTDGIFYGVKFIGGVPAFRALSSRTLKEGKKVTEAQHYNNAAPVANSGIEGARACKKAGLTPTLGICKMDKGPGLIRIADLKPRWEAEVLLGGPQIGRYVDKVKDLAKEVNAFAASKPGLIHPAGTTWNVDVRKTKSGEINIPDYLADKRHSKRLITDATLFVNGVPTSISDPCVAHVEEHSDGFLTYEWIPVSKAGAVSGGAAARTAGTIGSAKAGLTPVKNTLKEEPETKSVAALRRPAGPKRLALKRDRLEAKDNFTYATWKSTHYTPWQTKAKAATGGEGKAALQTPTAEAGERMRDEAMRQIAARSKSPMSAAPADTAERTRELDVVQHWIDHGDKYGRLRDFFGGAYVKVVKAYDSVKEKIEQKVQAARARMGAANQGTGGIKGAVLKAIRTIAGSLLGVLIRDVANRLVTAVQKGATVLLGTFFGEEVEQIEAQLKKIEKARQDFEAFVTQTIEDKFKTQLEAFEGKIRELESIAATMKDIGTLVNIVKWAYRVAQCLAPPALGCLLGLVGTVVAEAIIASIVMSCWFQREVAYPMVKVLGPVRALPGLIAKGIADRVRELLPDEAKPLMGEIDLSDMDSKPDDVSCDDDPANTYNNLDPNQRKLAEMLKEYDPDHVEALLAALAHLGLIKNPPDPDDKLTAGEIDALKTLLDKYNKQQLEDIASSNAPPVQKTGGVGTFTTELDKAATSAGTPGATPTTAPTGTSPTPTEAPPSAEEVAAEGMKVAEQLAKFTKNPP